MGGQGTDSLSGGAGADLFYFAGSDSNPAAADTILDYNGVEDDIVVQSFMLTGTATFIGSDAFTASGHTEYRVTEIAGVQRLEAQRGPRRCPEQRGAIRLDRHRAHHALGVP